MLTLVSGLVGLGAELLLLEHFEEWRQKIPLALIALGLAVLLWHAVDRRGAPVRALQLLMVIFVAAGAIGMTLHYQGNVEFELELYPSNVRVRAVSEIDDGRDAGAGAGIDDPARARRTRLHL